MQFHAPLRSNNGGPVERTQNYETFRPTMGCACDQALSTNDRKLDSGPNSLNNDTEGLDGIAWQLTLLNVWRLAIDFWLAWLGLPVKDVASFSRALDRHGMCGRTRNPSTRTFPYVLLSSGIERIASWPAVRTLCLATKRSCRPHKS